MKKLALAASSICVFFVLLVPLITRHVSAQSIIDSVPTPTPIIEVPVGLQSPGGVVDISRNSITAHPKFLTLPFPDVGVQMTQGWVCHFGVDFCTKYYGASQEHGAIDYARFVNNSPVNFDILAAASGTATCYPQGSLAGFEGYGNLVWINHDGIGAGYSTLYGHLPTCEFTTKAVSRGTRIGSAGTTGASTGIHLHFEARTSAGRIDPYDLYTTLNYYPQPGQSSPLAGPNHIWTTNPPSFTGGCCGCGSGMLTQENLTYIEILRNPRPPAPYDHDSSYTDDLKIASLTEEAMDGPRSSVFPSEALIVDTIEAEAEIQYQAVSTPTFEELMDIETNVELPTSPNYRMACSVFGMGGGSVTSNNYSVINTIGQAFEPGISQRNNYQVQSGFLQACGFDSGSSPPPPTVTPTATATRKPGPSPDYGAFLPMVQRQ